MAAVAAMVAAASQRLLAQDVQYSISNEFRYGIGERYEQDKPFRKEYLEDLFNTRLYVGDFTLGFRFQIDQPREYGRDTIGIKEYYAEFRHDGLLARGGTFYSLLGRGLVLNTFESRPLGFDTQTEGIKLEYESAQFGAGAHGGVMNYADIVNPSRVEEYLLRGASGTVRPIPEVGIGGSYLAARGRKTQNGFSRDFDAYLREMFISGNYEGFNGYLNFADKRTQLDSVARTRTSSPAYGYGAYGLLGFNNDDFGVTAEYKNYRFDVLEPNEQQVGTRATRALPFQNPPNLIPEHDKTLLARNPHAPDFSDELGFQLETLLYPTDELTVTLLAVGGSRHNAWESLKDSAGRTDYRRLNDAPISFPELKDIRYSPYWELYAHGEYHLNDDVSLAMALQRRDNVIYGEGDGAELRPSSETYKATTLMLESITNLSDEDNLHAILELQNVFDSKKQTAGVDSLGLAPYSGKYNNVLLTLEYSRSPRWAVNTRIEWTTTDKEQGGRRIWPVIGGTYRIGDAHTVGLQYGAERGGVVCTGGVCRLINPFSGLRFTVVSTL